MRLESNNIYHGDCLELMRDIADKSIDMILCDLPYGTTACKWDTIIPFEPLWLAYKRIIKPNGAIVLTASQPFTTLLINSNLEWFKYSWIWIKNRPSGVAQAKNKPMTIHEDVLVFSEGVTTHQGQSNRRMNYYPQGIEKIHKVCKNHKHEHDKAGGIGQRPSHKDEYIQEFTNYPNTILKFNCDNGLHPTQKPIALFEYLIKTYTNEGEVVLDNCSGSGTTAIACINTNRQYICMEKDDTYFNKSVERVKNHRISATLPL